MCIRKIEKKYRHRAGAQLCRHTTETEAETDWPIAYQNEDDDNAGTSWEVEMKYKYQ
jgi:hypothetical protein